MFESAELGHQVVIGGVDGAGKGETVNLLNEWMDPRHRLPTELSRCDRGLHNRQVRRWSDGSGAA
jgi:thymidylate kinase